MKKKGLIAVGITAAVIVVLLIAGVGFYNGLVSKQEAVERAQSEISNQLQRRADLIPNFVNTVQGYSDYEMYPDICRCSIHGLHRQQGKYRF